MTLEYFSLFYFIYPAVCIAVFFGLYFGLRGAGKRVQYWVLWAYTALNFALHFLKLAFPPYIAELPGSIRKVTFENICAVSTIVFPFFMLSKSNALRDYMFYLGVISGGAAMFAPLNVVGLNVFSFEVVRYYICHGCIWMVPLLMVILGIHKLDYHRIWKVPFMYYLCLLVILFNEVVLTVIGWVGDGTMEYFLSTEVRNSAFIFGPPAAFEGVASFLLVLTPSIFKPGKYIDYYMPILWEVVPVYVYGSVAMLLMCAYWEHGHMKDDFCTLAEKIYRRVKRAKIKNRRASRYTSPKRYYLCAKKYRCKN